MKYKRTLINRDKFPGKWVNEIFAGASAGMLMALSFPPYPFRFMAVLSLVPVCGYYLRYFKANHYVKRSLVLGGSLGIAFFLILLYWVSNLVPASSARMPWLMIPAMLLLVAYLSCYTMLFSLVQGFMVKYLGRLALFAAPAIWAVVELGRSTGELAFSWGILSSSPVIYPEAIQGLSIYGPFGFSMIIVLVNVMISFAIFGEGKRERILAVVVALGLAGGHIIWGSREIEAFDRSRIVDSPSADFVIVQPNTDLGIKWKRQFRDSVFNQIEKLAFRYSEDETELVVFPETAAPVSISHAPRHRRWLQLISEGIEADLLMGFVDHKMREGKWRAANSAGLFNRRGEFNQRYSKINLLPFGERMPYSQYIPFLEELDFGQANFVPGEEATIFESLAGRFGVLICFESAFPGYSRDFIARGADFLVNITNDGWFGSEAGPLQHAEIPVMRAVENRVPLLRSANTGVSMYIDPVGRIRKRIGLNRLGALRGELYFSGEGKTIYCRYGNLIFWLMVLVNLAIVLVLGAGRIKVIISD